MRNHNSIIKQRGAAIIVALFVTGLVAAAAVAMIMRLNIDISRTQMLLTANQAELMAQGSVDWAKDKLNTDWLEQESNRIIDKTPLTATDEKYGYKIVSTLIDMQGFFNINNMTDAGSQSQFTRLIQAVDPTIDPVVAQDVTAAAIDWISPNARNPAFDDYYRKQKPALRAPHHLMASISELRLVRGMTPNLYTKLAPYITALPETTPININNAAPPVIMSLSQTLTPDAAKSLWIYCQKSPFVSVTNFTNMDIVKNNSIQANKITVKSDYFLVQSTVSMGDQHTVIYTALHRELVNGKPETHILWQSRGTL